MAIDSKELEDFMPATELEWSDTAIARMKNVPFFVRKSVVRGIEQYAKDKGVALIDDDVVSDSDIPVSSVNEKNFVSLFSDISQITFVNINLDDKNN